MHAGSEIPMYVIIGRFMMSATVRSTSPAVSVLRPWESDAVELRRARRYGPCDGVLKGLFEPAVGSTAPMKVGLPMERSRLGSLSIVGMGKESVQT